MHSPPQLKNPEESRIISRRIVMPEQINPNGTLFGGVLMSWIDKAAFMTAQRHAELESVVTANIDQIAFIHPLRIGDHVMLNSVIEFVGRSSMEISVEVARESLKRHSILKVAEAYLTFVAVNAQGVPIEVPRLSLLSPDAVERYQRARVRKKVRDRVAAWFARQSQPEALTSRLEPETKKLA